MRKLRSLFALSYIFAICHTKTKNTTMEGKVSMGYEAKIESYPFAVFLDIAKSAPRACGASLLQVQVILTAATCMYDMNIDGGLIKAYFGANIPKTSRIVRVVVNHQINPKFDIRKKNYNLALGFLDRPVQLGQTVKKAILPPQTGIIYEVGYGVGWGKQNVGAHFNRRPVNNHLMGTKQRMMSAEECVRYSNKIEQGGSICSLPLGGHFYKDDAGAGLIYKTPNMMLLVAVLSHIFDELAVYSPLISQETWLKNAIISLWKQSCRIRGQRNGDQNTTAEHSCATPEF